MPRFDDEEMDDVAPRRKYRDEEDDEVAAPRKAAAIDDEDDDDTPSTKKRTIRRGWGAAEQVKSSDSSFAQRLKVTDEPVVIKFLEDEPYASYRQHWVERSGQKSFTCISDLDEKGCPLCDAGSRPSARFAFNVVALSPDDDPQVKSYEVGNRVIDQLKNFHNDQRQGPLTKHYWAVSRTGKGTTSATNHQMVKERDLSEEWNVDLLSDDDLKAFRKMAYDDSIIPVPKRKDLLGIASEDA